MDVLYGNSTIAIRLTGGIAATVCLVGITLIFLLLIFYKAYTSTLQRLLLYLTIITVIQEASMTVGYATQFEYSGHETFCNVISNVWQWSTTVGYLLTLVMIVYLPYKIYEQLKGEPFSRLSRSKCCRVVTECFFIFIVSALPLAYILPFIHCGYFLLQPQLCNMSLIDQIMNLPENCTSMIFSSQVPSIVGGIDFVGILVLIIALSVVFCCLAREYREARITLRRTLILLGFFVVYFIISLVFGTGVYFGMMTGKLDTLFELLEVVSIISGEIVVPTVVPMGRP